MRRISGQIRQKPNVIFDYNNRMSGIDQSDQMSYYQGLWKSVRWYKKIRFHYLEMFVFNAHWLYTKFGCGKLCLLNFFLAIVKSLLGDLVSQESHPVSEKFHFLALCQPKQNQKKKYLCFKCKHCSCGKNGTTCHE